MTKVCVIGCGYVGLTLAVYLAKKGMYVYGVDKSKEVIDALKNNRAHFYEANFDNELKKVINKNFYFGYELPIIDDKTVYIVTVGTPLKNGEHTVNLSPLEDVCHSLKKILKAGDVVILRSTVRIGVTRNVVKPILDQSNVHYYLSFCPERTLEGCAIEELSTLPQIVSGIDVDSLNEVKKFFSDVSSEVIPVNKVEEAEMAKLLNNSERDLKFALANEIALMCEDKGLDAYSVINAANYKYPRSQIKFPGPVGGPCLEKDPYILTEGFLDSSYVPSLFLASRKINESIIYSGVKRALEYYKSINNEYPKNIGISGFAFKGNPPTNDIRGSMVFSLIEQIRKYDLDITLYGHDYVVSKDVIESLGIEPVTNVKELLNKTQLVFIQNNHPSYKNDLTWEEHNSVVLFDFWNQIPKIDGNKCIVFGKSG